MDFKNNQMMEMITTQMNNLKMDVSSEKTCIQVLRLFMNLLAQLEEKHSQNTLSLKFLLKHITNMKQNHPEEYESFDMANIFLNYLIPLIRSYLCTSWHPINSKSTDNACRLLFLQLRPMLEFSNEFEIVNRYQHLTLYCIYCVG